MTLNLQKVRKPHYTPRPQFLPFHQRAQRWACMVCHRRAGKTVSAVNDIIVKAKKSRLKDGRYAYVAPYYAQAKMIAWQYLLKFTEGFRIKKNESELWVELYFGARIRLFGADNADAIRGGYLDGAVCDEFQDWKPGVFASVVRPMLADRHGWCTFMGTPKGHNEFFELKQIAEADPQKWFCFTLKASESNLITADELADARQLMSEEEYAQEFECDFESAILGAYYGREMRRVLEDGRIKQVNYNKAYRVFTSWDIGYSDNTAICFFQYYDHQYHFIDFIEGNGELASYWAQKVKDKEYRYAKHLLPHDAKAKHITSGKSVIEQVAYSLGITNCVVVANHHVSDGINATRQVLNCAVFDESKCHDLIEALRAYEHEYDAEDKVFKDKPLHNWASHPADAMRIAAMGFMHDMAKSKDEKRFDFGGDFE